MKKNAISFRKQIKAETSERISHRVRNAGLVEGLRVRFYAGQEEGLQVRPIILHAGDQPQEMVTFPPGTKPYLAGDDDVIEFDLSLEIDRDDEIVMECKNTTIYDYDLVIDVEVRYA